MNSLFVIDVLVFLVKAYLKLVLSNSREIGYCKIDLHNIHTELCEVCMKIYITLKQEIIKLVRLSIAKSIRNIGFSFS